jgi:hypothetical protein
LRRFRPGRLLAIAQGGPVRDQRLHRFANLAQKPGGGIGVEFLEIQLFRFLGLGMQLADFEVCESQLVQQKLLDGVPRLASIAAELDEEQPAPVSSARGN